MTLTAIITQVPFASFGSIEGLMTEDGSYFISATQANKALTFASISNELKTVKSLLGKTFAPVLVKTPLNTNSVKAISVADFEKLLFELVLKGNTQAIALMRSLVGLSLHQLFSDAFGVEVTKIDRQVKLDELYFHAKSFHPNYTSWLKLDGCEGINYAIEVNRLKACADLPLEPITEYSSEQLRKLNTAETEYNVLRKVGMNHKTALAAL